jgi:hypothetical protein
MEKGVIATVNPVPMNTISKLINILLYSILIINAACEKSQDEYKFEIKNEQLTRLIYCSKEETRPIFVQTYGADQSHAYLNKDVPYFEFVINDQLISSADHIWLLKDQSWRKMRNGGTEYKLIFEAKDSKVDGLEVVIYQQVFPQSTLVREKLELRNGANRNFGLNKLNDELHFKFPQYAVTTGQNTVMATEIKLASWEHKPITFGGEGEEDVGNHMFYPVIEKSEVSTASRTVKGPINIFSNGSVSWFTAYEHASQDNINGLFKKQNITTNQVVDAMQGVKGVFTFPLEDDDFKFLGIGYHTNQKSTIVSVDMLRGGYLDGESITKETPYATVWTATAFYEGEDLDQGKAILRNYLYNQICENKASRKPEFYYNTWGMQREISRGKPHLLRGAFTYDRIFKEIEYAAQLGVDLFVLDDGWEQTQGVWKPNTERLPQGLKPIKEKLDLHGIKMGIWLSPMGIDSTSERYEKHPDWVIKDSQGEPILAQWNHPAFDFVGPFFDVFIQDCKHLIDEGARFFKWDAINTFYSTLSNLYHGSDKYDAEEIRARYEYLLPIFVTRAMEILIQYEPELVIEMDVTEARRVMMGLAPLSQGKLFFMNNGASWYNDYSSYRAMSMRTIINEYNGLIPLELFTYANYPHDLENSMHYNVNNSLIAGHGFWGNLELMSEAERLMVGKKVRKSKKVLPYLTEITTEVDGQVGDSPEVYLQINKEESAGQIFVFSNTDVTVHRSIELNLDKFLCVLNHPYNMERDGIAMEFNLFGQASCDEAFIIPNASSGISIISSSCVIDDVEVEKGSLKYYTIGAGEQQIVWEKNNGEPQVQDTGGVTFRVEEQVDSFTITIFSSNQKAEITIVGV